MTATEPKMLRLPSVWKVDNQYTVGREAAACFDDLRHREMPGSPCNSCDQTPVAAKAFCEECFKRVTSLVSVALTGTIDASAVVTTSCEGSAPVPCCVAHVTIDGTNSARGNYIPRIALSKEITALPNELAPGRRVEAQFAHDREGPPFAFWFAPLGKSE